MNLIMDLQSFHFKMRLVTWKEPGTEHLLAGFNIS